jgi:hypothetical protein
MKDKNQNLMKNHIKSLMKTSIKILTVMSVLALAVAARAQVLLGGFQGTNDPTDVGWIDALTGNPITNDISASFVAAGVPGYAQSLQMTGTNGSFGTPSLELQFSAAQIAAFNTNSYITFTFSVPAGNYTSGYSQIYNLILNAPPNGNTNIGAGGNAAATWGTYSQATGNTANNQSGEPNFYFASGSNSLMSQTVTFNYSSFRAAIIAGGESFLQMTFQCNQGTGPTNLFFNHVVLSTNAFGSASGGSSGNYVVDDFNPNGVGPSNPTNYDYYSTANSYSAGQISNVWWTWFGSAFSNLVWDSTSNASNNAALGSMKILLNWSSGNNQFVVWDQGVTNNYFALNISAYTYTNFQCDVRWAPGSASAQGTYSTNIFGHLQFGDRTANYGQDYFGGANYGIDIASTNTNWVHVSIALDPVTDTNLISIQGLIIHVSSAFYSLNLSGPSTLWVDNIKFVGATTAVSNPPPTMTIQKVNPSLRMFAGSTGSQDDREELTTLDNKQSWVGASSYPVTYSFTLLSAASDPYFQTAIFLLPTNYVGNAITANEYMEFQSSNNLWLQIQPATNGNGTFTANVSWKTNLPNSNPNITALLITNPTAVGTWTLSFSSATSGTLTAPGASPAAFTITDPNVTTHFANPMIAVFGVQPNTVANEGAYDDYAKIQTTGVAGTPVNDNFTTDLVVNASVWDTSNSGYPGSFIPATATNGFNYVYWVAWTLPDTGFLDGLGVATNLTVGPWHLPEYYNNFNDGNYIPSQSQQGLMRWTLVPSSCLPTINGSQGSGASGDPLTPDAFFKLINPPLGD